jgi:hypothetical protein
VGLGNVIRDIQEQEGGENDGTGGQVDVEAWYSISMRRDAQNGILTPAPRYKVRDGSSNEGSASSTKITN